MGMKRTNYYFSEQMLTRLKKASVDTGYSVVSIIRSAIEAYLKGMGL